MTDNIAPSPAGKTEQAWGTLPAIAVVVAFYTGITAWQTLHPGQPPRPPAVAAQELASKISIVYGSTYPSCARLLLVKAGDRVLNSTETYCGFFPGPVLLPLDKVPENIAVEIELPGRLEINAFQPGAILQAAQAATAGKEIQLHIFTTRAGEISHKVYIGTRAADGAFSGRIYPADTAPAYAEFLRLSACAADGAAGCAQSLLAQGAPQYWENDPVLPTPLAIAAGSGRLEVVDALLAGLPEDFPAVYFARAILAASVPGRSETLGKLLAHPQAIKLGTELSAEVARAALKLGAAPESLNPLNP